VKTRRRRWAASQLASCALSAWSCAPAGTFLDLLAQFEYADVLAEAVDLPFLLSRPLLAHEGWQREDTRAGDTLLWMQGSSARFEIPLASRAERELLLRARCSPAHRGRRLLLLVSWNGTALGRVRFEHAEREVRLGVPASIQRRGENELRVEVLARGVLPRRALALSGLEVRLPGRREAIPRRSAQGLWLPQGAAVAYHFKHDAPPNLRLQARAGPAGAALVQVSLDDGTRQAPGARVALPRGRARLVQETLACPPESVCRLELASLGDSGAWIEELRLQLDTPPHSASASLPGRPNVIVFLVDALRADFLGAYGHPAPTSPRFDAFAREAVLFEDASAQSSWTRPSVASLLTGLGVDSHGVGGLSNSLVPEITTLPEAFRAAGYHTGAFIANGVVSRALGFDQGFESWGPRRLYQKPAASIVEAALDWIGAQSGSAPFFLYVHTLDPHRPYRPAPEHWAPFLFEGYQGSRDPWDLLRKQNLDSDELRFLRSAYQGEVHQNDAAFGVFLDGLRDLGLLERSVIVFTSDHGEEFFEHGGHGHSGTLYREALAIPLAIRLPGGARRAFHDPTPVQQIDVAPTLLALAGVAAPREIEGRDLSVRSLGRTRRREQPVLLLSRVSYAAADKVAARVRSMKLILNLERDRAPGSHLELYDLTADPQERRNLVAERPLVARYLEAHAAMLRAAQAGVRARLKAGREVPMTPDQEEQLRALGYIQ